MNSINTIETKPIENNLINKTHNINNKKITNSNVCNKSKRIKLSCGVCNKKLPIFVIKCKCNKNYCSIHRYSGEHNCTYDYQSEFKKELTKNNKKIKVMKVEKI
jgi:hypothetical protein